MSVLVLKSLPFKLLHLDLDPDGQYVLLHVLIECWETTFDGVYLPSPASVQLEKVVAFVDEHAIDNPDMDRLFPGGHFNNDLLS